MYKPSRDPLAEDRFLRTYVFPLGEACARARLISGRCALIEANEAKSLSFARVCLLVASGVNNDWEFTTVMEAPTGQRYGDLDPHSVEFSVARAGPPTRADVFELEVSEEPDTSVPRWLPGSAAKVTTGDDYFTISANALGLVSLAKQLAALSSREVPEETLLRYEPGVELEPGSNELQVKKASFAPAARARL